MADIVQIAGGSADTEAEYTGPSRELRADEDNNDLLLHDGSTPGGHRILSRDNADERYQGRSTELDGIGPYTPEQRGFLVRRAPGEYRLRKFTFSSAFTLPDGGDGYEGDVAVNLSGEINQDMRFLQDVIVEQVLQVNGGVNADTSGDHYGGFFGNWQGNGVGNTVGNHSGPSNGLHTGGLDARNAAVNFDDGAIPRAAVFEFDERVREIGVPIGGIIIWNGSVGSIPSGWQLCDGSNGTPDLRSRFVLGAGGTDLVGATGGAVSWTGDTVSAGTHSHAGSAVAEHELTIAEMPSHTHGISPAVRAAGGPNNPGSAGDHTSSVTVNITQETGGSDGHTHGLTITEHAGHVHNVTVDTIPPYYALCYIQHMGV